jgi:Icc protein
VMLDSYLPRRASGRLSPESLAALDQALKENCALHGIVCLHHHPIAMGSEWLDRVGLENAPELFAVLERHRNVRALLWGHVHQAHDSIRNGVRLLSTPSTCAQFKPGSNNFAIDRRPPGYRWLELLPDGDIRTEVVWVE